LAIGSEVHSTGLDMTTLPWCFGNFGDGAGSSCFKQRRDLTKGILSTHLHSEGQHAEELSHWEWEQGGLPDNIAQRPNDDSFIHMNG
jgi:3-oxoacyl-[acyl-carrier-protein] synthase-3